MSSFSGIRASQASIVAVAAVWLVSIAVAVSAQAVKNPEAAKLKNPVKSTPESIAAGKTAYGKYCKFCHGEDAKGNGALAPKDTHPPDLIEKGRCLRQILPLDKIIVLIGARQLAQ